MNYDQIIQLALERGFYFPSCEIYSDAHAGFWEYGPSGVSLKNKFIELWRREFVRRDRMWEIDGSQIMSENVFVALAREHKPKIIIAGASAYSLRIDFERFAKVAKEVGAILWVDMAHYAGLIAAGFYPSPIPLADVVTSTTHKTLRGPRGGIILMKAEHEKAINSAIFPGLQGGPLMHVIAGKAVAFKEASTKE